MKIGFKGFDSNLKCRHEQFEVGKVYSKVISEGSSPRLCSNDGYHYCEQLDQVYSFYPKSGSRFAIVEDTGRYSSDHNKVITTQLKILHEITDILDDPQSINYIVGLYKNNDEEGIRQLNERLELRKTIIEEYKKEEELKAAKKSLDAAALEMRMAHNLNLPALKAFQTAYPLTHVGGSVGLFLHGVRLKRFEHGHADLDIIAPYFQLYKDIEGFKVQESTDARSGNDFDQVLQLDTHIPPASPTDTTSDRLWRLTENKRIKVDVKIDPHQKYEEIEYQGVKYNVGRLEVIMAAKMKYINNKDPKHKDDIYEMLGKTK